MPDDDCGTEKILSETELHELVRQHRAKVFTISGQLLRSGHEYILALDGGGQWIVDGPWRLFRLVGRRVTVEGTRFGFNGIDVTRFKLEGQDWPPDSVWTRLQHWLHRIDGPLALPVSAIVMVEWGRQLTLVEPIIIIISKHFMHL